MRAVVQRVSRASVEVKGATVGAIGPGLMVLLGISQNDGPKEAAWLANKIAGLRIFPDAQDKLNLSVADTGGQVLVVSQFTLWGDCAKGRRPSFVRAAGGEAAEPLYLAFVDELGKLGLNVATGVFGAMMEVSLVNSGPVTLLVDTEKAF
ncbi:MAG: D-tyrosyl-tRNA(Tyr) deacylase [Desulfarculaceae bacterium]|nr:D-tyrosyl-tRNA(Tyr) deacylase [Desulfarculaceae bacterium]MCF8048621.1 D-tyrosyl-tRNA(Tyr) deacylase [Desulfarculaceae bacterium]MCF8063954.1 D-tyrosyl-tRNA(Tyr) deacylase [Desulfarculaceae bacterium]MCF8096717.1 D-tyrosyl-tRNA(Tyr) deacylase [Desulfarculaceae bacterium]MCF8123013.1 D-tyrosyl-tRNA(Tyr) deacylase [Desulfarculaceae bacterium]